MEDLEVDQVHSVGKWFFLTSSTGAVHHWTWRIVFILASRAFPAQDAHQAQPHYGFELSHHTEKSEYCLDNAFIVKLWW